MIAKGLRLQHSLALTPGFTSGSYYSLSMGPSGLGSNLTSDIHLLFDLGQVPPTTLSHNVLIYKMEIRLVSSPGPCEKKHVLILQGAWPRTATSKWSVGMSPSLPPPAPVFTNRRAAVYVLSGVCGVGNYPGDLTGAQLFAEHLTQHLIPEQSIDPATA